MALAKSQIGLLGKKPDMGSNEKKQGEPSGDVRNRNTSRKVGTEQGRQSEIKQMRWVKDRETKGIKCL